MIKVTIGMPTFNRAKTLKRAIEQVLNQTYQDYELIIYNDGSTDDTVEVVNSFSDNRIIFINEKNKGLPHPLNKILELAQGEYIIILHDHDKFNPQLIEKSVKALDENPEAGFVLQANAWINSDETTGYKEFILDIPPVNDGRIFGRNLISNERDYSSPIHACCMVRKSAYEKIGKYYDEKFGWYCDVDLWFRLLKKFDFVYLSEILFTFTGREANHLLTTKTWEVNEWLYQMHKVHIPNFFTDNAGLLKANDILETKKKRFAKRTILHSLFSGDKTYIRKSLQYIEGLNRKNLMHKIFIKILSVKILQKLILEFGVMINKVRKRILR